MNNTIIYNHLDKIIKSISVERLSTYLYEDNNLPSKIFALKLYKANMIISESLYPLIQGLEVTLRNSIHCVLTSNFGNKWYTNQRIFREPEQKRIHDALSNLQKSGKQITTGRVVAGLSFGFRYFRNRMKIYGENIYERHFVRILKREKLRVKRFLKNSNKFEILEIG